MREAQILFDLGQAMVRLGEVCKETLVFLALLCFSLAATLLSLSNLTACCLY